MLQANLLLALQQAAANEGEEEAAENLPESLQESERAERMREVAEELGGIVDEIETKESELEDLIG